ncbi:MAG: DUF4430 domain-containing protein [Gaiellales bacterium]
MVRRTLVLAAALVAAAAVAAPALGLAVHVRVEGARTSIYGAHEPRLSVFTGALAMDDGSVRTLTQPTALGALESASRKGEFFYNLHNASFGPYVDQIGRRQAAGFAGWVYKVNGVSPPVGADNYIVQEGDHVVWYWADFAGGSPSTLDVVRRGRECYRAFAVDDTGTRTAARNVTFRIDGFPAARPNGIVCPRAHWHRLRATKPGLIRSELIVRR